MAEKLKILLLGAGTLAFELLQGLLDDERCEVSGVFRWCRVAGGGPLADPNDHRLLRLMRDRGLPEIRCDSANGTAFAATLSRLRPDCVLVGSWGEIFRRHVLQTPGVRFVNCHPSLLPAHRGTNPYASAILNGECESGVSFHLIDEHIDTGPVLLQETVPITPNDTGATLRSRCAAEARRLLPRLVEMLSDSAPLAPIAQAHLGEPSYFARLRIADGLIDWARTARHIQNQIRGLQPWLHAYTRMHLAAGSCTFTARDSIVRPSRTIAAPGTIVERDRTALWVSTGDEDCTLGLTDLRLQIGPFTLPRRLSALASAAWLRPGRRFSGADN